MVSKNKHIDNSWTVYKLVGKNMKRIRLDIIKKSQIGLSMDSNLSRSFISQVESPGVNVGISIDVLHYLAQRYNFDIREFFVGYEDIKNNNFNK